MKIYTVLRYDDEKCRVIDHHISLTNAKKQCARLYMKDFKSENEIGTTFHIIKKSLKGLKDIKFEIDSHQRYIKFKNYRGTK